MSKFFADINTPESLYLDFEKIELSLYDPERMQILT